MALVWVYSSQALAISSGLPDELVGHISGGGLEGVVEHLDIAKQPDSSFLCQVCL